MCVFTQIITVLLSFSNIFLTNTYHSAVQIWVHQI